ncbi:MAG: thermonuclease family protein [Anaeroplasmataceae bacterium]|nr:thermonuclease family protein [Anaeroplasmataceae bacterium]
MKKIRNILLILCSILALGFFASCKKEEEPGYVDYVEQTKLNINVTASHKFFGEDGIAFATLVRCVDGDTAVFIANDTEFTARFLGVDTPESTGQVEKWGKTASKFTAEKLTKAVSLVVQTNGGAAQLDTTGNRYLTYIWYKPSADADYRLINLELVQEGLSYGKSETAPLYKEVLIAAQNQAMQQKLRIFGDDIDENFYYGDAKQVTIKYILENSDTLLAENAKVRFEATVVRKDGLYIYVQDYDAETDKVYSILLYTGYNFESKKMVVANRVSICGNIQEYEGNIQISGLRDTASKNPDNIQFIEKDYEIKTTSITAEELINATSLMERMFVKLENVKVTSLWTTKEGSSAGAITITGQVDDKTVTIRTTVLRVNYELVTEDYFDGKTITVMGFIETYNGAKQIKLVSVDDVAFVE